MKITIDYNGSLTICKVNDKPFYQCDPLTKAQVISAFRAVEKDWERSKEG